MRARPRATRETVLGQRPNETSGMGAMFCELVQLVLKLDDSPVALFETAARGDDAQNIGDLKITSTSTERQKRSQNLAPVLLIISGKSLVFSRKIITSTDFYRYCAPDASAPVVVINQSPRTFLGH